MSTFDAHFARVAANNMATKLGTGASSAVHLAPDGETETTLSHLVLGDERREWQKGPDGQQLTLVREAWAIIDPSNSEYCGIANFRIKDTIRVGTDNYRIVHAVKGQKIVDLRLTKIVPTEYSRPEFRGRQ